MYITAIKTNGFRNLKPGIFEPVNGCNIILGANAQGKTCLLEAIYLCSMGASFRQSSAEGLVAHNKAFASIRCTYVANELKHTIDIYLSDGQKRIAVDGAPIKKRGELIGKLPVVMFSPDDLNLVKGSPVNRRKYMDKGLSQIYPSYYQALGSYYRALKNRNADLKQGGKSLDAWDEQLCKYGIAINSRRKDYISRINSLTSVAHKKISTSEKVSLKLEVDDRLLEENTYFKVLQDTRERDMRLGSTGIGPHKDDIEIKIGGKEAKLFASQGQQRTIAIAMKLAELYYLEEATGEKPVLLLDDVMSELDKNRQQKLMAQIGEIQSFITTTHLEIAHKGNVFTMNGGVLT